MKIVMDTNAFISCVGLNTSHRLVFDAFLRGRYHLCVTTEVLLEYEEKFSTKWTPTVANNLIARLLIGPNITQYQIYFRFHLVPSDADDNKFADLAIVAGADYLVSNDRALLAINKISFPKIEVLTLEEFAELLRA